MKKRKNKSRHGYTLSENGTLLHRQVCRKYWGKFPGSWVVHHCNGKKQDNDPNNLVALPERLHGYIHAAFGYGDCLPTRSECLNYLELFKQDQAKCFSLMRSIGGPQRAQKALDKRLDKNPYLKPFKPAFLIRKQNETKRVDK